MEHLFIECVRKHPCLWKTDMEEYKMNHVKEEAWRNVIKESDVSKSGIKTVKEAKYLWKKLRDMQRQAAARRRKDKAAKKWKHEDQMGFLVPYTKWQYFDNVNETGDSDFKQEEIEIELPDDDSGSTTPKLPRKTENVYIEDFNRQEQSDHSDNMMARNPELDSGRGIDFSRSALESFFASMCEMTSALPEHIQIRVERKVFDVVMEAREEHLQNQMTYFHS